MNFLLVLLNIGLATLNGFMAYSNYCAGNHGVAIFNAFACGFCAMGAFAITMNTLMNAQ